MAVSRGKDFTEEACLGCSEMSRSLYPPTSTLEVYIEDLTGLSHVHHPGGLSTPDCSRKPASLKMVPTVGTMGRKDISGMTKEGEGPLIAWILLID